MTFFEDTPDEQPRDPTDPLPPWFMAPGGQLPGLVADRKPLARSGPVAVSISHLNAYPAGCEIVLQLHLLHDPKTDREAREQLDRDFNDTARADRPDRPSSTAGRLQLGVELPDGTKVLGQMRTLNDGEPDGPVLQWMGHGGRSGPDYNIAIQRLWLWPLPPAEPFDLVLRWPRFEIPETSTTIDGAEVNAAANRTHDLAYGGRPGAS